MKLSFKRISSLVVIMAMCAAIYSLITANYDPILLSATPLVFLVLAAQYLQGENKNIYMAVFLGIVFVVTALVTLLRLFV